MTSTLSTQSSPDYAHSWELQLLQQRLKSKVAQLEARKPALTFLLLSEIERLVDELLQ